MELTSVSEDFSCTFNYPLAAGGQANICYVFQWRRNINKEAYHLVKGSGIIFDLQFLTNMTKLKIFNVVGKNRSMKTNFR